MKKGIYYILLLVTISSCKLIYHTAPSYLKNEGFTYRYNNSRAPDNTMLKTNGYYTRNDTTHSFWVPMMNMIFFDDGMFVSGIRAGDVNDKNAIPAYLDSIISMSDNSIRNYNFYENLSWGYYNIFSDTVRVQYIQRPSMGSTDRRWYAYEIWFRVIENGQAIEELQEKPIHKTSDWEKEYFKRNKEKRGKVNANFVSLKRVPKSDGWLMNEQWFLK